MKILVVDDDPAVLSLLLGWLEEWTHQATVVADGNEAIALLNNKQFDLVLSSWTIHGLSGLELCRSIRANPRPAYCYVIVYSLNADKVDFDLALDAGADDCITKPLEEFQLRVRIRAAERILTLRRELSEQNASLSRLNEKLSAAYKMIQSDLQAASDLQVGLMPTISEIHP